MNRAVDLVRPDVTRLGQLVMAHGGKPMPCTQPLSIQKMPRTSAVEPMPKKTFIAAESSRPVAMKTRALTRSPMMPLKNFDTP